MVKRVDDAVFEAIKRVKEGTFKGGIFQLGLAEYGVDYVYDDNNRSLIPDSVRARVEALRAEIVAGRIKVPIHAMSAEAEARLQATRRQIAIHDSRFTFSVSDGDQQALRHRSGEPRRDPRGVHVARSTRSSARTAPASRR